VNRETVPQINTEDLGMWNVSTKVVPQILTDGQKQSWFCISSVLLHSAKMFDRVISGNAMWYFQYDPETERQSKQWKTQNSP
jgi:hypothetical protein